MAREKKLFLLDAMALIYRAHFAFINNPRITSTGLNTSAIYGFATTVLDIIQKEKPTHLAVCTDVSSKTFRHEYFPEYKAGRQETPEDIKAARPYIEALLDAMNIPYIGLEGYEADDLIGTLAKKAQADDFDVYMMTPDKDFAQIVDEHIYHYKPARPPKAAEIFGVEETLKKWEIRKIEQVIDILGLMGDKVDNIPGIMGVGEKSAIKFIRQFGSIENLLENTDQLKGKQKERVENGKADALISKRLATIDQNAPIEYQPDKYILNGYNTDKLKQLFEELEFRTLGKRIFGDSFMQAGNDNSPRNEQMSLFGSDETVSTGHKMQELDDLEKEYYLVNTPELQSQLLKELRAASEFAFDTETSSLDALNTQLVGWSFSIQPNKAYYLPINEDLENWKEPLAPFVQIFEDASKTLIGQNIKFDLQILQQKGFKVNNKLWDTMLAHYIIDPDGSHGMDLLSESYLNYRPISIETLIGKKGKNQASMKDIEPAEISDYAAEDADITLQLKHILAKELEEKNGNKVFNEIECPLVPVLTQMEAEGITLDVAFLKDFSKEINSELLSTQETVFKLADEEFNLNSPKQLGEVLFGKLKLDAKAKKTKSGQYKTDEATLSKLAGSHDIINTILEYRGLQKLKSTYVDKLPEMVNPKTGRIHSSFRQAIAATGRLSSDNPNLQNIPIKTEKGRKTRKAFIARGQDYEILSADYSQVELRIVASMSQDEAMTEAFNNGLDIHTATAAKVFGVALDEVDREMRGKAKAVNFGIIYGQGAFGLAQNLNISRTEAKEIIDSYFERFSGLKTYMNNVIEKAKVDGYVETLLGRRRYLRDINSVNHTTRAFAERNAINAPVQGTAADIIKIAMINIHNELQNRKMKSKMILQVHDELLFDAHISEKEELKTMVIDLMSNAYKLNVPLLVEANFGKNWLEAH